MRSKEHWDRIYENSPIDELGWYEEHPTPCLKMLELCNLRLSDTILDVGVGASTFIDCILELGYLRIVAADISVHAIRRLKHRLGKGRAAHVQWLVDDLASPEHIPFLRNIALWHDRACLHFLVDESHQQTYFDTLKRVLKRGGYVMIAAFSLEGAEKCSGLDVIRYDENMLAQRLGSEFELLESFHYTYYQPAGDPRPCVYTLYRRSQADVLK